MRRDLEGLTGRRFDLLVVGGGIHGLFAAYEAASRGLAVALVEASDFGSGATFNHQRTLHGGMRALQSGNLIKTRRQIGERRTWAVIAPHLVRPLPFLVGTYRFSKRSRLALRAGFTLYDRLGRRRNAGVAPELHLPRARLESRAATRALFPGIRDEALTGGAVWYDYQTRHPERLTLCVALAAAGAGATLANYVEAIAPLRENGRVTGCRVRDRLTGAERDVEATVTLLAAGGRLEAVQALFDAGGAPPVVHAMGILIDRPARDIALAASSASGRMLTAVPWAGKVLVGTYQSPAPVPSSETEAPDAAIDELLADANSAFPALAATRRDIRLLHQGLAPAVVRAGRVDLMPEPQVIRHSSNGVAGLVSLVGVKYTTARLAARQAVEAAAAESGARLGPSRTAVEPLPHAGIADAEGRLVERLRELGVELDVDVQHHLTGWYGTEAPAVASHAAGSGGLERLSPDSPVLCGELTYAASHAAACRLADVILRRSPLAAAGHPGDVVVRRAAEILRPSASWSAADVEAETAAVARALGRGRPPASSSATEP